MRTLICLTCGGPLRASAVARALVHDRGVKNHAPVPGAVVAARDVEIGDKVRVLGLSERRRVTYTVDIRTVLESGDIRLDGRNDHGRWFFRVVAPLNRVEVFAPTTE